MGTRHRTPAVLTAAALAVTLAGCAAGSDGGNGSSGQAYDGGRTYAPGPNGAAEEPADPSPGEQEGDLRYQGLTDPTRDPLSTFALDIDTGSYTRFRDATRNGTRLPSSEVRTEEFVNYFRQDYTPPRDGLAVSIDAATLPFQRDHRIVRVGVSSAVPDSRERPDADLALVVDCSGSMGEYGKMETTKAALRTLVANLRPTDRVAMVCYSTEAEIALRPTPAGDRESVEDAIDGLGPRGSTNAAAGLEAGYDLATDMRREGRMTRVVLVSDGVANVGERTPGGILERIGAETRHGVNLVSVGVGIATYNDTLLEQLADQGDGWHVYVDTAAEAERVFATGLTGSLVVAATDAKAQVEFDPRQVAGYRLIGYENRAVADEDFRDDAVDGGEVFAGHTTTALYDVALRGSQRSSRPFVTATVRYQDERGVPVERTGDLADAECADDLVDAPPRLQQDLVVALLTDHLVGGPWSEYVGPQDLRDYAAVLPGLLDGDADVAELADLVDEAVA
ncbi:vWA domain-containing protein [Phycicoccus flavus]|uniref:DUF3520 domain-containing protein n=1 Tax=Phycicoccus flavus TaxID=2502783 RepID=A0A8T6R651_9MICO|nr:von Willebrand factor type A domain-containing protein [Phycicoccus flavus]NHA69346.1 DUF3520 domain-containing protein [Phycicoccus flavus]